MSLQVSARGRLGALDLDVDLRMDGAPCLALCGPSGAGKTSVLRVVAGLQRLPGSRVEIDGRSVDRLAPEARRIGYVPQDLALFGHLSAWRNVAYALRDRPRGARRAEAMALLERFGLAGRAEARPLELSGGERQRVALARALARRPRVLLLDEPLASLDVRTRAHAARELAALLAAEPIPAILVTHDFAEAALLAGRVAVMDAGRIVQSDVADRLAAAPSSSFVAGLTGANVLHGRARAGELGLTRVALDGGGEAQCDEPADGRVALSVFPWEVALEPAGAAGGGSARNRLAAEVTTVTVLGNRARVGLVAPQPLAAEITAASAQGLGLAPGVHVTATWKTTATRLIAG